MSDAVIRAVHLRKTYTRYRKNFQKMQDLLLLKDAGERIKVLRDISFEISRGEKVGIIGGPLSGKSTLMRILGGIIQPDSGEAEISGDVMLLLDNKLGFETALTGRDNYEIRSSLLGWPKVVMKEREEAIFRYAGISDVIDEPIRTYKKGRPQMLGFAISTVDKPEIMLFDEKFNFGSRKNARKAGNRLRKLVDSPQITLVMTVSDAEIAGKLCTRGIVIHRGKVVFDGPFAEAMEYYDQNCKLKERKDQIGDDTGHDSEDMDPVEREFRDRQSDSDSRDEMDTLDDSDDMVL